MSVSSYDEYVLPFYKRPNTVMGNSPAEFSKAAFLAFVAQFPDFPIGSANQEFLQRCFEKHFKKD